MARTANDIAALFYERFRGAPKQEHDRHHATGAIVFIQGGRLSCKQVRWLEDVWGRENPEARGGNSHKHGGVTGTIPAMDNNYWSLYIAPNGAGVLSVYSW